MASRFGTLLAGIAAMTLGSTAFAGGAEEAGSLLVFPCYDNARGVNTYLTVSNTNLDVENGTIKVEYVYINGQNCLEFNRTRTLTPGDTLTVNTRNDNPNATAGYVYVFAKNKTTGAATSFNHLIGTARVANGGEGTDLEIQPFMYKAIPAEGANTDVDSDGIRDLNGAEYEKSADQLFIPRFTGQGNDAVSELVMINLTGGSLFTATVDLLIWNDNEEVFSGQHSFDCWQKTKLEYISAAFNDSFLKSTNHNLLESLAGIETGFFWINGLIASSTATSINNPAVLGVLIETIDGDNLSSYGGSGAVLPFGKGEQDNGDLVPHSVFGDQS